MKQSNIIMYTTEDGLTKIEVTFDEDTVWLSLDQMAELFQRDKSTISRHIKNIFTEGELRPEATVAKFATVQTEGNRQVTRDIDYYNLDVIISVGYRVKSLRGTHYLKMTELLLKCRIRCSPVPPRRRPVCDVAAAGVDIDDIRAKTIQLLIPEHGVLPVLPVFRFIENGLNSLIQEEQLQNPNHVMGGASAQNSDPLTDAGRTVRKKFLFYML